MMGEQFFSPGSVVWDLQNTDKFEAIRETVRRSAALQAIPSLDLEDFTRRVIERERVQSTGFGRGIAIAHGRTDQVTDSALTLGVSRRGIDFDAFDGRPVHLLFVVANHPDKHIDYLRILSCLATMGRNEVFRRELLTCLCKEEIEQKVASAFRGALLRSAVH